LQPLPLRNNPGATYNFLVRLKAPSLNFSRLNLLGPTSNHALFRKLSATFAHSLRQLYSQSYADTIGNKTYHHTDKTATAAIGYQPPHQVTDIRSTTARAIPASGHALFLIDQFFTSIGLVLPFVEKEQVLGQWHHVHQVGHLQCRKSSLVLLNMIWAHASHSLHHDSDAHNFTLRASHFLSAQDLAAADVEMCKFVCISQQ
jgi:hypothetical protein